jgi:hypothetical protein
MCIHISLTRPFLSQCLSFTFCCHFPSTSTHTHGNMTQQLTQFTLRPVTQIRYGSELPIIAWQCCHIWHETQATKGQAAQGSKQSTLWNEEQTVMWYSVQSFTETSKIKRCYLVKSFRVQSVRLLARAVYRWRWEGSFRRIIMTG